MAGIESVPEREVTAQELVGKIQDRLGKNKKGLFLLDRNRFVTMNSRKLIEYPTGKEFKLQLHTRFDDTNLFVSTGVEIIVFPKLIFYTPAPHVKETLEPHVQKRGKFKAWKGGKNIDPTIGYVSTNIDYPLDLAPYKKILEDPHLQRVEKKGLSTRIQSRAEHLYMLAIAIDHPQETDDTEYIASYKFDEVAAAIRYQPGKGIKKSRYRINFREKDDAPWEVFSFTRSGKLVYYNGIADGTMRYATAPPDRALRLATALDQFDGTDLQH